MPLPRLFVIASKPRVLWSLAALTLLSGVAMLPAISTMAAHGVSLTAFEFAGGAGRSQAIVATWGEAGKVAAWWQLAIDTPFLVGYGLFLAGACAAVATRAGRTGRSSLQRAAVTVAWLGPLAAVVDLLQNFSLALILSGYGTQPWPRIAAVAGVVTCVSMAFGLAFALVGAILTRSSPGRAMASGGTP